VGGDERAEGCLFVFMLVFHARKMLRRMYVKCEVFSRVDLVLGTTLVRFLLWCSD